MSTKQVGWCHNFEEICRGKSGSNGNDGATILKRYYREEMAAGERDESCPAAPGRSPYLLPRVALAARVHTAVMLHTLLGVLYACESVQAG